MWTKTKKHTGHVFLLALIGVTSFAAFFFPPRIAEAVLGFGGFGGQVLTVVPCLDLPGKLLITIKPAGLSPISQIWMPPPATLTFLHGPPVIPGQWVLGVNLGYGTCVTSFYPYTWFGGALEMMIGTSLGPSAGGTGGSAAP